MLRIAILEDDSDQADLLSVWLEEAGYSCHSFADASAFQRQFHRQTFDLLIFDWELPESSGIDALRWVRANSDWKIPVLFVTRREREEDIVYALEQGADAGPYQRAQRDFVERHPGAWLPQLIARLEKNDAHPFFRALVASLSDLLSWDQRRLATR